MNIGPTRQSINARNATLSHKGCKADRVNYRVDSSSAVDDLDSFAYSQCRVSRRPLYLKQKLPLAILVCRE